MAGIQRIQLSAATGTGPISIDAQALRTELQTILNINYNNDDLEDLIFRMGLDHERIGGENKRDAIRELILYCERRNLTGTLIEIGQHTRPEIPWPATTDYQPD